MRPVSVAKAATTTIPIVFGVGEDPVQLGLVASIARPGGNATGINFLSSEVVAKRLLLLHDMLPNAVRIAVLVNPRNTLIAETTVRDVQKAAPTMGHGLVQRKCLLLTQSGHLTSTRALC